MKIILDIAMLSDWGVGSGQGRQGAVDRLIVRDADGLPMIPAATLRGIWRDAAERLAYALDDGRQNGPWVSVATRLFGGQPAQEAFAWVASGDGPPIRAPIPARLAAADARSPKALRERLRGPSMEPLRTALTFVKPGVSIDSNSGVAKPNMLRFDEMARQGARLSAVWSLNLTSVDAGSHDLLRAFLIAAAGMIEELGGKRRRGAGRCAVVASDPEAPAVDLARAAQVLKDADAPQTPSLNDSLEVASYRAAGSGAWVDIALTVTAMESLLFAKTVRGNVVEGADYVPGSALLTLLTRALIEAGAAKSDVQGAIMAGDIRSSPAYPLTKTATEAFPAPACWSRKKDDDGGPDGKGAVRNILAGRGDEDGVWRPLKGGAVNLAQDTPIDLASATRRARTHNTVEDRAGKPTRNVGGVYTYQAIEPGGLFSARLRLRAETLARLSLTPEAVLDALNNPSVERRLGRARHAGRGLVRLKATVVEAAKPQPHRAGLIYLWLVSDLALRPEFDAHSAAPREALHRMAAEALDVPLDALSYATAQLATAPAAFLRSGRVDGWHGGWGAPRASLLTIQAGGVAVFQADGVSPDALARLEAEGLGAHKAEGYGRVRVNHPIVAEAITAAFNTPGAQDDSTDTAAPALLGAKDADCSFAKQVETAAWRDEIRRRAEAVAASPGRGLDMTPGAPPMSQLGALRSVMGNFADQVDADRVCRWLEALADNPLRAKLWPAQTRQTLAALMTDKDAIWRTLDGAPWPPGLTRDEAALKSDLRFYAIRSLIAAAGQFEKRGREGALNAETEEEAV